MYHDRSISLRTVLRLSTFILFAILLSCEQYDDPLDENWDDEELNERANAQKSGCEGKCSSSCRCSWTEVGCSSDRDCQSGLYCKMRPKLGNRCLKKQSGDVDIDDNDNDNNDDCHEFKPGHGQYCSSSCPCKEGEGDCDKDSHCKSGLVCKQQSGTDFCVRSGGGDPGGGDSDISSNSSTSKLVRQMASQNKVFVFDKDKTLLGGNTSKIKAMLRMITDAGADMAILTSNKTKTNGQYAAIGQLQRKFGKTIFPNSFFRTDAFQVNDDNADKTKANEMRKIINYYGVKASDVVFYDDKQYNITDVTRKYSVVGIKVNPDTAMTESDFRRGMLKVLD